MKYTPIFEQDGHEFVAPYSDMIGDTEHDAFEIAMGTMLVEGGVMNFKPTKPLRYLELTDDGKANVTGWHSKLGAWDVVILDTAAIEEAKSQSQEITTRR